MPIWNLRGQRIDTGVWQHIQVDAPTEEEARRRAEVYGLRCETNQLATQSDKSSTSPEPATPPRRLHSEYGAIPLMALLLKISAATGGIVGVGIGIVTLSVDPGRGIALGAASLIVAVAGIASGDALLCLREIAINTRRR